jgi:hypothetical protein
MKYKTAFMNLAFSLICTLFAMPSSAKEHREHEAHVHGSGNLGIAFDGTKGKIGFKIPSESIFGFEHVAKSEKDKKAMDEGLKKLETKISEMIVFDQNLGCKFSKEKINVINHGQHGDTVAAFSVDCEKSPLGSKVTFNFQNFFPGIKDLDINVLIGSIQKSIEAKKSGTTLELK